MSEKLKNQDKYVNTIISVLALGNILEKLDYVESLSFLFIIMIITLIVQLRIMANRNTVMYIASYLCELSKHNLTDIQWESKLSEFKASGYGIVGDHLTIKERIINLAYKTGRKIQHFGVTSLSIYTLIQIGISLITKENLHILFKILLSLFALFLLIMTLICTYTVCVDDCVRKDYERRWFSIINRDSVES